jgi:MYND finger
MSRCKSDKYCSAECQKAAWPTHTLLCKQVAGIIRQNPQQEEDINSWCMDETVRSDLTKLAAYGLHAIPPAQSLVGSSAMIVQTKYIPAKRTVVIQHAQIMSLEVSLHRSTKLVLAMSNRLILILKPL